MLWGGWMINQPKKGGIFGFFDGDGGGFLGGIIVNSKYKLLIISW